MEEPPPRIVTLVLCSADGVLLGALPPFEAETPWWQDLAPVVEGARARFAIDVVVLRLLTAERPSAHGGGVSYLAETDPVAAAALPIVGPWPGTLTEDPLRHPYARPGGPAADLAWADGVLAARGLRRIGPARQYRSWNLSSLWSMPTTGGTAWLKVVPPFFGHEGTILERLAGGPVPSLLGHNGPRMLLAEIPGDDRYDAPLPELRRMVDLLVGLQTAWLGRADELLSLGLPDWRASSLRDRIAELVERRRDVLPAADRAALERFVDGLADRFAAVATCGLGDGLVHGDFHPGNLRGDASGLTLLDWGDCGVGHPLLDEPGALARIPDADVEPLRAHWHRAWRAAVPGSDPEQASRLIAPVAAARMALIYQGFLDRIETAERPYHEADVPDWLRRTADLARPSS